MAITDDLGVPWAPQKWLDFEFEPAYVSFLWDYFLKCVLLLDMK